MTTDPTAQTVLFPELISKPVVAAFDQAHSSRDGGALLLKAIDAKLGLSTQLAGCLRDGRHLAGGLHEERGLAPGRPAARRDVREITYWNRWGAPW